MNELTVCFTQTVGGQWVAVDSNQVIGHRQRMPSTGLDGHPPPHALPIPIPPAPLG